MLEGIFGGVKRLFLLTEKTQQLESGVKELRAEVKELRAELQQLTTFMRLLAARVEHNTEAERHEREKLALQLRL